MIRWTLREYLDAHDLSAYAVLKGTKLAPSTVYKLARGEQGRVDLEVLEEVLTSLRHLTGRTTSPNDLIEFVPAARPPNPDPQADLLATDVEGLGAALEDLEGGLDPQEVESWRHAFVRARE